MCVCVYTIEIYLPYPTMCLANKKNASIVYDHHNHKENQCLNLISYNILNSKFTLSNLKNTLKKCFIGKLTKVKRCLPHYNYNICAWVSQISDFPQPEIFIQGV